MNTETTLGPDMTLTVSLRDCIDRLSSADRQQLISAVAMDRWFLQAVVDQLVEGLTDTEWWFDNSFYTELRIKLMEKFEPIGVQVVRELINQRDQAKANQDRHVEWAWSLYRAWLEDDSRRSPPPLPSFVVEGYKTEAEALQILLGNEKA